MSFLRVALALAVAVVSFTASAQTSTGIDAKVQTPELKAPVRASLAGQLAGLVFGPADVTRGSFGLPSPFALPQERGATLASPFPSYSLENGVSEWGTGWQTSLAVTRMRVLGDLDYATDDLTGPFGRMVRGTDGSWYPLGMSKLVRLVESADTLTAYLPDGTRMIFGGAARVVTARGTYAWHLTEVLSVTGRKTRVDWTANTSGRQFATSVWYGGIGDDYQYRVDLAYETLPLPFQDYRSGQLLSLDRRVSGVTVLTKHASTGVFEERWRYELGYADEGFGPGFHLASVQQVFRSGERPPPTTYAYYRSSDKLASAALVSAPKVTALLSQIAPNVLQPDRSTLFDENDDGVSDLEWGYDYRLARQTDTGFTIEPLPSAPDAIAACRSQPSALNKPRALAQMRSGVGDETQYVVSLQQDTYGTNTYFNACNRLGQRLAFQTIPGLWALGPTIRLVDVNRDHKPDLVRVEYGRYRVLPNTSTATTFSFGTAVIGTLTPAFTPDTAWVHDFNGDGIPDLIARSSSNLVVWYGKGGLEFVSPGRTFPLRTASGTILTNLSSYGLTFVDANKDGLTDVVLSGVNGNATKLFMNRGTEFQEIVVPGLQSVDAYTSKPVAISTTGGGDTELTFTKSGQGWAVALDGAETGLMAWADDGRGTAVSFEYARAVPSPGGRQRQIVLSRMSVQSSGYGDVWYDFAYGTPTLHSSGKFLLGYDQVQRTAPLGIDWARFLNDDRYAGLLLESTARDALVPGSERYSDNSYDDASYQGIPRKRLVRNEAGWRATDGTGVQVADVTRTTAWWGDFCEAQVLKETSGGTLPIDPQHASTLTIDTQYATLPAFAGHLACLRTNVVESGTHVDPTLDFRHETAISRNDVGLVTRVSAVGPAGPWTLQDVSYTPEWLVERVSVPGRGATVVGYAPGTRLPAAVTSPVGIVTEVVGRDPVANLVLQYRTTRAALVHNRWYAYDGRERLQADWDDLGASTRFAPDRTWSYVDVTPTRPGAVTETTLVNPATLSVRTAVDLYTAAGTAVASAGQTPGGWAFGPVSRTLPATGRTEVLQRAPLSAPASPLDLDWAALYGANPMDVRVSGPFGVTVESTALQQVGVERRLVESLFLDPPSGRVVRDTQENALHHVTSASDAAGRVTTAWDEAGTGWTYAYDALGRLRSVRLPDGALHKVGYDVFGRVARIDRDGVASVEYRYDATSGLVVEKRFLSAGGQLRRTVTSSHDGVGRVRTETHAIPGGASQTFTFYYDGATPERPTAVDAPGFLTAVVGDGFVKRFEYRADGRLLQRTLELGGWRRVVTAFRYAEAGDIQEETTTVYSGSQTVLSTSRVGRYGATGRVEATTANGVPLASYGYDENGLLSSVQLPAGTSLTLSYDSATRRLMGSTQVTASFTASATHAFDTRGLVAQETFAIGQQSFNRTYGYSPQRFLSSASQAQAAFGYQFEPSGLPSRIVEGGITTDIVRTPGRIVAGSLDCDLDDLGRTTRRGDLSLEYGPTGDLVRATRGARTWTFVYDEAGHRLAKLENGVYLAAYLADGYLDASGLVQPVTLGGRVVGVLRNGAWEMVATDLRGTVIAEPDGTVRLASPIGRRDVHPAIAAALDFVEKGFDADLGFVRMGVRDYDPELNQFTTPDPLVLEQPERVFAKRFAGNLYSYAGGDPISFIDPDGTEQRMNPWAARGIGVLQLVGAGLEAAGGVGALAVPEPTGLTKVGGVLLLGHAVDTGQTALRTIWSGEVKHTLTQQAGEAVATAAGASPETARKIGIGVDIAAGAGPSVAVAAGRRLAVTGAEEGASMSLAYLHRGATQIGHNAVGVASEGRTLWFDLAGKPAASFAERAAPKASYLMTEIPVAASSARTAMSTAEKLTLDLGSTVWKACGPNCATTAREVLTAGGVATPEWARTPLLLHLGVNYGYEATAAASAATTAVSNTGK